ncbi:class I adenylate-forming enzyme family protein [Prauserella oleivorans]|uniref:Class I adenylate-forming enzyme family protein n=1 Tax=Prauserella oleivorans TaxID=1478153 RepID=A0ABW5W9Y1_9PSEU
MFTGIITRQWLQRARGRAAERPALTLQSGDTWTYAQLAERSRRYANGLWEQRVRPGDRVGILMCNSLEYVALYLAITRLGAIAVRLNWRLTANELRYVLADSGTSVLCVHGRFVERIEPVLEETPVRTVVRFVLDPGVDEVDGVAGMLPQRVLEKAVATEPEVAEPDVDTPCMLMYTSGTTGFPKGALWTHGNTVWFAAMQALYWNYDQSAVHLSTTPMFHVSGFEDWLLPVLFRGGHVVVMRSTGITVESVVAAISQHRVRDVFLVPALIYQLMSWPELDDVELPSWRRLLTGGSPLVRWAVDAIRTRFPDLRLEQAYGLTEGGGMATVMSPEALEGHPTSVGRPLPLTEAKVVDPVTGTEVPPDTDGELWLRSPSVCGHYWGKPEETAQTFVDGWCRTGDLARITGDGYIYIIDRLKDMIVSGGENVYPAEIENVLAEHPGIVECAVVGVPDAKYDETPCAVIVRDARHAVAEEEVIAYCRAHLAGYKCPRHVVFVDTLPRNASGKILKRQLREEYQRLGSAAQPRRELSQ